MEGISIRSVRIRGEGPARLLVQAVQDAAGSVSDRQGHAPVPLPMGLVETATALWHGHLRHDPANPHWPDRDRVVWGGAHAAALTCALARLSGYAAPDSATAAPGRGLVDAVALARDAHRRAARFNRPGHAVVDHRVYAFVDDGCLRDDAGRACASAAATERLDRLIALFDDPVRVGRDSTPAARASVAARIAELAAVGWRILGPVDAADLVAVGQAIAIAKAGAGAPTLIVCRRIALGGWLAMIAAVSGGVAREAAVAAGSPAAAELDAARRLWDARALGRRREAAWRRRVEAYRSAHPALAADFNTICGCANIRIQ